MRRARTTGATGSTAARSRSRALLFLDNRNRVGTIVHPVYGRWMAGRVALPGQWLDWCRSSWNTGSLPAASRRVVRVLRDGASMPAQREEVMKALLGFGLALVTPLAFAQADIEAGKAKVAQVCAACHGANGVSVSDTIPNLAGAARGLHRERSSRRSRTARARRRTATRRSRPWPRSPRSFAPPTSRTSRRSSLRSRAPARRPRSRRSLPNLAKTNVTFPDDYKQSFVKYHTINFPATRQVRHYYANKAAIDAAKANKPLPDRLVPLRRGVRRLEARRQQASR